MELNIVTAGITKKKEGRNHRCCREHYEEKCGARTNLSSCDRVIYFPRTRRSPTCRSVSDDAASKGNSDKRHQKSIQNTKPRGTIARR